MESRRASAHAPRNDNSNKSSTLTRQAAQHRVEMAYAYGPIMLVHDRRVLDIPLEQRLKSRTSDLVRLSQVHLF
jgi:hypothetical protein